MKFIGGNITDSILEEAIANSDTSDKTLTLINCTKVTRIPDLPDHINSLNIDGCYLSSFGNMIIHDLYIEECNNIYNIPGTIMGLTTLYICRCFNLRAILCDVSNVDTFIIRRCPLYNKLTSGMDNVSQLTIDNSIGTIPYNMNPLSITRNSDAPLRIFSPGRRSMRINMGDLMQDPVTKFMEYDTSRNRITAVRMLSNRHHLRKILGDNVADQLIETLTGYRRYDRRYSNE